MTAAWFQFNKVSTEAPSFEDLLHMMWVLHTGLQAHYYMQSIVTYLTSASFPRNYSILFKPNRICSIYMYKKKQRWTIKIDNVQVLQLLPEDNGLQHCCSWKYCGKWCSDSQGHLSEVSPWLCEDNLLYFASNCWTWYTPGRRWEQIPLPGFPCALVSSHHPGQFPPPETLHPLP